jgi:hypothetical protein
MTIEAKLKDAWRQERRFIHLRGLARFVIWLLAMILVDLVIDWGLIFRSRLPGEMRYFLLMVNAAVLLWVLWREWWRHLRPFDPVVVALEVEREHPELASVLVSYTQMDGPLDNQPNVSQDLVEAMRQQAVELAKPLNFREVVDFGQLRALLGVCGSVILLFALLSVNWSGHFRSLFLRLAGVDTRYPTATLIESVSGNAVVREGDDLLLRAEVSGRIPQTANLYVRTASDTRWRVVALGPSERAGVFVRRMEEIFEDFSYYVRVGDDHSDVYAVSVVSAPRIVDCQVTFTYPDYMQREPETIATQEFNFEVPEGTRLRWQLSCEPAVSALHIAVDDDAKSAEIAADGKQAVFELTAAETLRYAFTWIEAANDFEFGDVQHTVRVIADMVPSAELLQPTTGGLATLKKTVAIHARAADDHGLSKAFLLWSIDGRNEERLEIADFANRQNGEIRYEWSLQETIPDLKDESIINFSLEVTDAYPPAGTHTSRSASRRLTIVDSVRYLAWFRDELNAQRAEIARARDTEVKAAEEVKQLLIQERPVDKEKDE